jgi:hypothetical protein
MTDEQKALAKKLRSEGKPYQKIGRALGVSETCVYKFLIGLTKPPKPKQSKLKPKPKPVPKILSTMPMMDIDRHFSCPTRKFNPLYKDLYPQTKLEMYETLALAVRNTAQL